MYKRIQVLFDLMVQNLTILLWEADQNWIMNSRKKKYRNHFLSDF